MNQNCAVKTLWEIKKQTKATAEGRIQSSFPQQSVEVELCSVRQWDTLYASYKALHRKPLEQCEIFFLNCRHCMTVCIN